jgi:hypothetical protein
VKDPAARQLDPAAEAQRLDAIAAFGADDATLLRRR